MTGPHVIQVEQQDRRLGRQVVHDERSRGFQLVTSPVDRATWKTKSIPVYGPVPNPDQCHGECTGVAKACQLNARGNRKTGRVLGMPTVHELYGLASSLDPFPGDWTAPQWVDQGSSGLASAKAAQQLGLGGEYRWLFGGADQVVQAIMDDTVVSVGTWWTDGMFDRDPVGLIRATGPQVGGHQWVVHRYDKRRDLIGGLCWWGGFKYFWMHRGEFAELLADDGDAHVQTAIQEGTL